MSLREERRGEKKRRKKKKLKREKERGWYVQVPGWSRKGKMKVPDEKTERIPS